MSYSFHDWTVLIAWALACIVLVGLVWIILPVALQRHYDPSPEETLHERLAAGEFDADEYRVRLSVLHQSRRPWRKV